MYDKTIGDLPSVYDHLQSLLSHAPHAPRLFRLADGVSLRSACGEADVREVTDKRHHLVVTSAGSGGRQNNFRLAMILKNALGPCGPR